MKKAITVVLLALIAVVFVAVPVFAADGISAEEQALLDKYQAGREIEGVLVTPMAQHVAEAEAFLLRNDLNAEEIQRIDTCMEECWQILEEEKVTAYTQMKNSPRLPEVVEKVNALAHTFRGYIEFNPDNGFVVIKQTGFNMTTTVIIVSAIAVAVAAAAVVVIINRKSLFAKAA